MEIVTAIIVTGLGLLGGMAFIWQGRHSSSTKNFPTHLDNGTPQKTNKKAV